MSYEKQRISIRYWLLGAGWHDAAGAMTFAESYHRGVRKDGVTPEFSHQVAIACHVRTLAPHLLFPQECVAAAFLHDVREDYNVPDALIRRRFGDVTADAVDALTKVFNGVKRDPTDVFAAIADDPVASICKLADRVHNQHTMVGVFSPAKVAAYVEETETYFLPMLKIARRQFPSQEGAYENLKLTLTAQLHLLEALGATGI